MSEVTPVPNHLLSEHAAALTRSCTTATQLEQSIAYIMEEIKKEQLAPYYKHLHETSSHIPWDEALYSQLVAENEKTEAELKAKIEEVEKEEQGELESAAAWVKLGEFYTKIGNREVAIDTLTKAYEKAISVGAKIDIVLTITRIGFFFNDQEFVAKQLEQVAALIEKGGDWERRNRYKTYRGIHLLAVRDFNTASELLVDSLATFTSSELVSYETVAMYATVAGLFALSRTDLKTKIIDSPELLSLATDPVLEPVTSLTISLYTCEYSSFFKFLLETYHKVLLPSKYLSQHADYYIREVRKKCYAQLLDSYKTLSLKSMANAFGVSVEFLDKDLGKFIPNKQLNCVIDRVNGIVETNRPDNKNSQYHLLIKQGDVLLTKLQKYGAAVKLSGTNQI